MFTYICFGTSDLATAARFYDAAMGALGHARCDVEDKAEWDGWIGWGTYRDGGAHEIALWVCKPFNGQPATAGNGTMVALQAKSWRQVDAFHAAAISHGGSGEGAPGLRPQYNPDFYAAYVRDPDGNKLAAVCRGIHTAPVSGRAGALAAATLAAVLAWLPPRAPADPAVELPAAILERYTGYYVLSASSVITVTRAGAQLLVQIQGQPPAPIDAQTPASFVCKTMDARIDFMPNPPIEITALVLHQQGLDHVAPRIDAAQAQAIAAANDERARAGSR